MNDEIYIDWLHDSNDCETCGGSYAEGARVFRNGEFWFELTPHAHCFGGDNYDDEEVYRQIFERLGVKVTTSHL